jgi:RhtB (resistance to homoserine/threonine) family protein
MTMETLTTFAVIAALMTLAPGVDTILVIRNTVRAGTSGGLASAWGICCGLIFHALISSVGLAVLLAKSATAFQAVRIGGAIYLVWLGIQSLRRRSATAEDSTTAGQAAVDRVSASACFAEGLVTNLLNPKVVLFYLAILPQFLPEAGSVFGTSLTLAGLHAAMGMVWLGFLSVATGRAQEWLRQPGARAMIDRAAGVMLIGFGLRVALGD